jgi:hypothetical protein
MFRIQNNLKRDVGILPQVLIPAGGSRDITEAQHAVVASTAPFQAAVNAGHLLVQPIGDVKSIVRDVLEAPKEDDPIAAALAAVGASSADPEAEVDEVSRRADLIAEAKSLGVRVTSTMKTQTIEGKIADAKSAQSAEV